MDAIRALLENALSVTNDERVRAGYRDALSLLEARDGSPDGSERRPPKDEIPVGND